jgi:hypothetical protein
MAEFRGSDESLDREIAAVEAVVRVRLRRYAREMRELDRDLAELRRIGARRRATSEIPMATASAASASAER